MARTFGWCSRADVVTAFKVVGEEIRSKCHRFVREGLTQAEAGQLARRIKDQRDLIRQLADRRNATHARRLMRLHRRLRERFLAVVRQAGLNPRVLILK